MSPIPEEEEYSTPTRANSSRRQSHYFSLSRSSLVLLLLLLLFAVVFGQGPLAAQSALAASHPIAPEQSNFTLQQALKLGRADSYYHGDFKRPQSVPAVPSSSQKKAPTSKLLPSAEPAKMKPFAYQLDASFVVNQPQAPVGKKATVKKSVIAPQQVPSGTAPLKSRGSDGRFEIELPRGAFDVKGAVLDDGTAPVGPLTLQVTQQSGHTTGQRNILGVYTIAVVDSQGKQVHGITLRKPLTLRYYYQANELSNMDIDPQSVVISWPQASQTASSKQKTAPSKQQGVPVTSMKNNSQSRTLTAQVTSLAAGPLVVSGDPDNQAPPIPHMASVSDNAGQLSYSYPIAVPPGPGGFAPQLALNYSSESTNERTNRRSASGVVGEGWSLTLGSITKEHYPSSSTVGDSDWYFLSGVDNVSDRLVQHATGSAGVYYDTEHMAYMRILYDTSAQCFKIWGTDGTYYELGCTSDSKQYTTVNGTRQYYRWDLNKIFSPFAPNKTQAKAIFVSYLQETPDGGTTIRDSAIKQITYGYVSSTTLTSPSLSAGTISFSYLSPEANSPWASQYSSSYYSTTSNGSACSAPSGVSSSHLRCDNPPDYYDPNLQTTLKSPQVMSTLTLKSVTSYIGSGTSQPAYQYDFSYADFGDSTVCYDAFTAVKEYCAGNHLLTTVTPSVFQNGQKFARKPLTVNYSGPYKTNYYDPYNKVNGSNFTNQTYWDYVTKYVDAQSGTGETITYQEAFNNTNGTPYVTDSSGKITDDRHDPLYCSRHVNDTDTSKRCEGVYLHPETKAWSKQVVTQIQMLGKDSSDNTIPLETTTYNYSLPATGTGCNAITGSGVPSTPDQTDCVGDTWIPGYDGSQTPHPDGDWQDYYHGEYRGFNGVFITSASGNVTAQYYYSTEGWGTPQSNGGNYNRGQMYQEDVFWGNDPNDTNSLIRRTSNDYTGLGAFSTINSCNGTLNPTYNPCVIALMRTTTTTYEGGGINSSAPSMRVDYTYDDVDPSKGYILTGNNYHNLLKKVYTPSNAPQYSETWEYDVNDSSYNGFTYHMTDKVTHHEVYDSTGKMQQCTDNLYDEGLATGEPDPEAGLLTSTTTYADCGNKSGTAVHTYTSYDLYGTAVGTVDAFGAAHSSIYNNSGCTPGRSPNLMANAWVGQTRYTTCTSYDLSDGAALPQTTLNALGQSTTTNYDYTQGAAPPKETIDVNGQHAYRTYSYAGDTSATVQTKKAGETNAYTSQSVTKVTCDGSQQTPCVEVDQNAYLYTNGVTQTFYDYKGRAVETRTPLDANNDLVSFTVYNDSQDTVFNSVPFRFPHSVTGWVDPATAKIDNTGAAPSGTLTLNDPLGRVHATRDPLLGSASEPGITCDTLSGTWSTCNGYAYGYAYGDSSAQYSYTTTTDANNHMVSSFTDALGHLRYQYWYSQAGDVSNNITTKQTTQYDTLGRVVSVTKKDLAPQANEATILATATVTYDMLGRMTSLSDPDRGNHTYTYDEDGRVIKDVSTSGSTTRTIGTSYDLLGRIGCIQDAAPTTDGTGSCSSGSHPLVQNTYDASKLGTSGSTDFSIGQQTQSVSTTYYPDSSSVTSTYQYQHDQRGRLITSTLQIGVPSGWNIAQTLPTYKMTQLYNNADQPTMTQTFVGSQNGYTTTNVYDSATGVATGLSNNSTAVANLVTQSYGANGLASDLNFLTNTGSNLANDHFGYDGNLRPQSTNVTWQSGSGATGTIYSDSRAFDAVGNVVSRSTTYGAVSGQSGSGGSQTQNFCYDELNRLVWAGNSGTQPSAGNGTCGSSTLSNSLAGANYNSSMTYTYLGQIWQGQLNGTGGQWQYLYCDSTHPHQLTGVFAMGSTCSSQSGMGYGSSFDGWGNQVSRNYGGTNATLSYNSLDQLVQYDATSAGQTDHEWYGYDASGQRTVKRSTLNGQGGGLTVYPFGLEEHVYDPLGNNYGNTYYYKFGGRLIGKTDGTTTQFYLTDALGSVVASITATANAATIVGSRAYSPYGATLYNQGQVAMGTDKGFTGQYGDATGLDYYNARYYDPVIGRFLSVDTVQDNFHGFDPYAYVQGNPETKNDPTGHLGWQGWVGLAILGVAVAALTAPIWVPAAATLLGVTLTATALATVGTIGMMGVGAIAGAVGGVLGHLVSDEITGNQFTADGVLWSAGMGAGAGFLAPIALSAGGLLWGSVGIVGATFFNGLGSLAPSEPSQPLVTTPADATATAQAYEGQSLNATATALANKEQSLNATATALANKEQAKSKPQGGTNNKPYKPTTSNWSPYQAPIWNAYTQTSENSSSQYWSNYWNSWGNYQNTNNAAHNTPSPVSHSSGSSSSGGELEPRNWRWG